VTKQLVLALALLCLTVTTSFAQRGTLTLGWNNCRVNGGGVQNSSFACNTNGGEGDLLVGGFIPSASANLNSLYLAYLFVDIYQPQFTLDPWWTFIDPPVPGCRKLSIWGLDPGNASGAVCDRSYWSEVGSPWSASRWFNPTYRSNHGTFRVLVVVDSSVARTTPQIGAGEESFIFGARLGREYSTGAGSCAGCLDPAHLYFAEADFFQTNFDYFVVDGPGPFGTNLPVNGTKCATWQVQQPQVNGCPSEVVPVRNHTWGALKSLYR